MSCWPSEAFLPFFIILLSPLVVGFFIMFSLLKFFNNLGGKYWQPAICVGMLSEFFFCVGVWGAGHLVVVNCFYTGVHYLITLTTLWLFGYQEKTFLLISGVIPLLHFLVFYFLVKM